MARHDALARIEPVARDLLARVDTALVSHGAPADHPIWTHLRRLHATPADAVAFFADGDPETLLAAGAAVRDQAAGYRAATIPARVAWHGTVGDLYVAQAAALHGHLGDATHPGPDSLAGRLVATASYVDSVAEWWRESRGSMAVALAEVLTSAQAIELSAAQRDAEAVPAAADIGAHVLAAAARAHDAGYDLLGSWSRRLDELPYRAPEVGAARFDATIDIHH
jgi:hypothetical protein